MASTDYLRLVALASIWGASFIFLRNAAPEFGVIPTAWVRVELGGAVLLLYFRIVGFDVAWRRNWRRYAIIGSVNSAIPFSLYSFAALYLPASYSAIFNSTTSLFGALFAALLLADPLTPRKLFGLLLGVGGVALVAGLGGVEPDGNFFLAVVACLVATMCYAIASVYVRKYAQDIEPRAIAGASQAAAGLALLPLMLIDPPDHLDGSVLLNLVGLAVLSSAIAYLLFYRLLANVGPVRR